jgi:ankyrin repeat protein
LIFCSNLAHLIPTTAYLDKIFDLSLFYNESKSEILYTIKFYFILNLHLVSYHTTSKQDKYTWPKNIILLFYAFDPDIVGNNTKIVIILLDNEPDLKTKDSFGRTVFHYVYMCENPDINAMLKEHRYLMHSSNDNSTFRSWNIKRWIMEHITKYLTTKLQLNVC